MKRFAIPGFALFAWLGVSAPSAPAADPYHWYHEAHHRAHPDDLLRMLRARFLQYMGREPDPAGLRDQAEAIRRGQPPEVYFATLLGSQEYFDRAGDTPEGFVEKLFLDLAGRRPTGQEMRHWVRYLYHGDRAAVVQALMARYPQSWGEGPYYPDDYRYDYRRPRSPYRP